ncbi:MAG: acyltransferase [Lachnospiraceae bacterium]|nr:acyltransferase [Lachnospiraceae bacterium]
MKSKNNQDTAYLDLLRWIAISAVVMLHVVSGVVDTIPEQMTVEQQNIYEMIKNMMTVGVPVFLMISGSLFLNPEKEIGMEQILKRYLSRILLALFLFGVV